jgi:hypothetical protein
LNALQLLQVCYLSRVEWLQVVTEITQMLDMNTILHYTTLQKAAARLSNILLHVAIERFINIVCPGKIFAGFEDGIVRHTIRIVVTSDTLLRNCL